MKKRILSIMIPALILCVIVWFYYPIRVAFTVEMPEKEMLDTGEGDYTGETARVDVTLSSHVDLEHIPDEPIMFHFVREAVEGAWACSPSLNDITVQLRKPNDEITRYRVPLSEIQPLEK